MHYVALMGGEFYFRSSAIRIRAACVAIRAGKKKPHFTSKRYRIGTWRDSFHFGTPVEIPVELFNQLKKTEGYLARLAILYEHGYTYERLTNRRFWNGVWEELTD